MAELIEILRSANFENKPSVEDVKALDGVEEVTAAERDKAWKTLQAEKKELAAEEKAAKKELAEKEEKAEKAAVKKAAQPTHTVTVKKDGFRRLGRAWSGSEDVKLVAKELEILEADPMFVVVEL